MQENKNLLSEPYFFGEEKKPYRLYKLRLGNNFRKIY